jgi:small-conductance mechanosensitive channel
MRPMDYISLDRAYFGNSLKEYLAAALTFLVVSAAFLLIRRLVVGRLRWLAEKTVTKFDDLFVELLEMIRVPECYLVAFYLATRPLTMPGWADRGFRAFVIILITYRVARMLQRVARFLIADLLLKGTEQDAGYYHTNTAVSYLSNALIWALAVVFTLDNLGFSVSSIVAGLGIGGIAVALAAQAVLGDLFAAIALYMDRPFVSGDTITFGDATGTVKRIGFKTTILQAVGGERLVVPNSQLASSKVQNWSHLRERRVVQTYSAAYGTPQDALERIPSQLRALIQRAGEDKVRVDRVHLSKLAGSSIDFELVYFVLSPDFNVHMDIQQRLHLAVLEAFAKEKVEIPFPTQTLMLSKGALS